MSCFFEPKKEIFDILQCSCFNIRTMATIREYFDNDFKVFATLERPWVFVCNGEHCKIIARMHFDQVARVKFITIYVPVINPNTLEVLAAINFRDTAAGLELNMKSPGEESNFDGFVFAGTVYIYSEDEICDEELSQLMRKCSENGLSILYRGPRYALERFKTERPLAFISHDSRDKDTVARRIAVGLQKLNCPVWYDEFSLKVGDPLRESIEKGIRECHKCILILSSNFLSNHGWTKVEFNSIFTREIVEVKNLILPVWVDVGEEQLYKYCPTLVNRYAVKWCLGEDEVVKRLYDVLSSHPSHQPGQ